MHITMLCVGRLKERYWEQAQAEYLKRLRAYARLDVVEVAEEPFSPDITAAAAGAVMEREGERLLRRLHARDCVLALDREGTMLSSPELADILARLALDGKSSLAFIIGGSLGLAPRVTDAARRRLSFSRLTFPHQLMRIILLEQIYRAFKINRREPYHR